MGNSLPTSGAERERLMSQYMLTEEQMKVIERLFKQKAGIKGHLNFKEFKNLYSKSRFDMSSEDVRTIFRAFTDSDRKLRFFGFLRLALLCQRVGCVSETERLQVLFDILDADGNRMISMEEFHAFIVNFVEDDETIRNYFERIDRDNSNLIDFDEFQRFCSKHKRVYSAMCAYVFQLD